MALFRGAYASSRVVFGVPPNTSLLHESGASRIRQPPHHRIDEQRPARRRAVHPGRVCSPLLCRSSVSSVCSAVRPFSASTSSPISVGGFPALEKCISED